MIDLLSSVIGLVAGIAGFGLSILIYKVFQRNSEKKVDYIYKYFKIKDSIRELDRFTGVYSKFLDHVKEEIDELASGRVVGREYLRRQRLVEFALNMALVYARVEGNVRMIPKIEEYQKMAKKLH